MGYIITTCMSKIFVVHQVVGFSFCRSSSLKMIHRYSMGKLEFSWLGMALEKQQVMPLFSLKQKNMVAKHCKSIDVCWVPAMLNCSAAPRARFNRFSTLSITLCIISHHSCCHRLHNSLPFTLLSCCLDHT